MYVCMYVCMCIYIYIYYIHIQLVYCNINIIHNELVLLVQVPSLGFARPKGRKFGSPVRGPDQLPLIVVRRKASIALRHKIL